MEDIIQETGRKQNQGILRKFQKGNIKNLAHCTTYRKLDKDGFETVNLQMGYRSPKFRTVLHKNVLLYIHTQISRQ